MNHIHRLQADVNEGRTETTALYCGLQDLETYLTSSKFIEDPTVQVADVLRRIHKIKSHATNLVHDQRAIVARNNQ